MADWWPFLFKILSIFAHNLKTNRNRDFVFLFEEGVWGYAESSGDGTDDVRFKMANRRPLCLTFSTFLLITSEQMENETL